MYFLSVYFVYFCFLPQGRRQICTQTRSIVYLFIYFLQQKCPFLKKIVKGGNTHSNVDAINNSCIPLVFHSDVLLLSGKFKENQYK